MSDKVNFERIRKLIEAYEIPTALKELNELLHEDNENGEIDYYIGICAVRLNQQQLAGKCFRNAILKGYENAGLLMILGKSEEAAGNIELAEKHYRRAIKISNDDKEIIKSNVEYALFSIRHNMPLNAKKIAKMLVSKYPNKYNGHHIQIVCALANGQTDSAEKYIKSLENDFSHNPAYLIDKIEIYEQKNGVEELDEFLNNKEFLKVIPQYTLEKKYKCYMEKKDYTKAVNIILLLGEKFDRTDCLYETMLLLSSMKNYELSMRIGTYILGKEKLNANIFFFLTLELQMRNYFYFAISQENLTADLVKWIERAGNWCVSYANKNFPEIIAEDVESRTIDFFNDVNKSMEQIFAK